VGRKLPASAEEALALLTQGHQDFAEVTDPGRTQVETRVIRFDARAFGWLLLLPLDVLTPVVVSAHAQCGAVTEAANVYLEPRR